jgi:hypothetical protein
MRSSGTFVAAASQPPRSNAFFDVAHRVAEARL